MNECVTACVNECVTVCEGREGETDYLSVEWVRQLAVRV